MSLPDDDTLAWETRFHLKNNSFTKAERDVFTRSLKNLLTPDVNAVAHECGLRMGLSMHIPHLKVISTMKLITRPDDRIDDATIEFVRRKLAERVEMRREEYETLLGCPTSDFSKLATVRLCWNYKVNGNEWQMDDIYVNEDLLHRY